VSLRRKPCIDPRSGVLSSWDDEPDGAGNWVIASDGSYVDQTINGEPTFFIGNMSAVGQELNSTGQVRTKNDDDFFGFVMGFTAGDNNSAAADYLLLDWKQGDQSGWDAGMALSRVTGIPEDRTGVDSDFWQHTDSVEFLTRATTLGSTGWSNNAAYEFRIIFDTTRVRAWVDNVMQFDVAAPSATPFSVGNFGFYNFSQSDVRHSAITQNVALPAVPLPAAAWLGLTMLGGMAAG